MNQQENKTIYQASYGEVFLKNFLAGVARGLGSLFIWFLLTVVIFKLLWPQLQVQINQLTNSINNLQLIPQIPGNNPIPENININDINKLINQYVPK